MGESARPKESHGKGRILGEQESDVQGRASQRLKGRGGSAKVRRGKKKKIHSGPTI